MHFNYLRMHHSTYFVWTLWLLVSILPRSFRSDSEADHNGLFITTKDKIYKIDLETSEKTAISDGLSAGTAIDYDLEKGVLVVSDVTEECLYKVNIDTGNKEVLATGEMRAPEGVAVDWIHGNVYWTDAGTRTISIISLDGKLRKVLIDTNLNMPAGIVVNPLEGWMFWSDWGHFTIERSGMDGTQRSRIVDTATGWPNGLAIDFDSRKIYWIESLLDRICSSDYDGSNMQEILHSHRIIDHPFGFDVFEDWMFWADWNTGKLYKAKKLTGESAELVASGFVTPTGIRFLHSTKQPKGINYCEENGECSHFCLPAPRLTKDSKNFTCACPDGMSLTEDQKNCTGLSGCGGNLTDDSVEISSPLLLETEDNFDQYPHNVDCTWWIRAPKGSRIRLTFISFSLQGVFTPNCSKDYVLVEEENGHALGKFCGHWVPPAITSQNNTLRVTFRTDESVALEGFTARYHFFNESSLGCGGNLTDDNDWISSPRLPKADHDQLNIEQYPHNVDCTWWITAPKGSRIRLTFASFFLEGFFTPTCSSDYVLVEENEHDFGKFCGTRMPPVITSQNNTLRVTFRTDESLAYEGFTAKYHFFNTNEGITFPSTTTHFTSQTSRYSSSPSVSNEVTTTSGEVNNETMTDWVEYETQPHEIEVSLVTETSLLSSTSQAAQPSTNVTLDGTAKEETGGAGKTIGVILGILLGIVTLISVVGFCIYKLHLRRNTIKDFKKHVNKKIAEDPVSFESGLPKESVTLPIFFQLNNQKKDREHFPYELSTTTVP